MSTKDGPALSSTVGCRFFWRAPCRLQTYCSLRLQACCSSSQVHSGHHSLWSIQQVMSTVSCLRWRSPVSLSEQPSVNEDMNHANIPSKAHSAAPVTMAPSFAIHIEVPEAIVVMFVRHTIPPSKRSHGRPSGPAIQLNSFLER